MNAGQGSISVSNKETPAAPPVAATSYHGWTPLVSANGDDATAATAVIVFPGGKAWDWILPFQTLAAAFLNADELSTIRIEKGNAAYPQITLNKTIYLDCAAGVVLDSLLMTTANKILKVTGKPDFTSSTNKISVSFDNGVTGSLELGTVIGGAGLFFRGRTGQQIYLTADKIDITQSIFTLNACIHIGAAGANGSRLYADVSYINMNITIANPLQAGDCCAVYAAGSNCISYVHGKLYTSNTPANGNVSGWFRGVVTARAGATLYVNVDKLHNIGLGRAFTCTETNANLYLNCSEIRVTDAAIEAGNISDNCNVYFKSGCRVIAGTAATYAVTAAGTGTIQIFIDGTVYSNKPLDPAVTLMTGTWVVDANIV